MNKKDLINAIGRIDESFLSEAIDDMSVSSFKNEKKRKHHIIYTLSAISAIAACICLFFIFPLKKEEITPVSYLCIDINPSLELGLDKDHKVINATGINDDGKNILKDLKLTKLPFEDALNLLFSDKDFKYYIDTLDDLTITVISDDDDFLCEGIKHCAKNNSCTVHLYHSSEAKYKEAHEHDCSLGKYLSYEELIECDSTLTLDDCRSMTMHELHDEISHCHENHNEDVSKAHDSHHTETSSDSQDTKHHQESGKENHHGH